MIIPFVKKISLKRLKQLERDTGSQRYRRWRELVLARDYHKCQYPNCGSTEELEVHHIRRYVDARHLRYEPFNGITLCSKHHLMVTGREAYYELFFYRITFSSNKRLKVLENESPKV